jgi:deoxyinosine 3'endonuclease (endonuclease V)
MPPSRTCWPNAPRCYPRVPPYRPGQFYLRELPPLHAVLDDLSGLGLLVVDGYADLDPAAGPAWGRMHMPSSASR